jgi:hypothetical protein
MPDGTVAPDRFDQFRELHAEGLGRNAIARAMSIPQCVASRTAEHLGLDFDRSRIQAATRARLADFEERRSILAERLLAIAEDSLSRIYEETTVFAFGGKDNEFNDHVFPEAPVLERQKLLTSAAIAIDKSLKLVPPSASSDLDNAKSMLTQIGEALVSYTREDDTVEDGGE